MTLFNVKQAPQGFKNKHNTSGHRGVALQRVKTSKGVCLYWVGYYGHGKYRRSRAYSIRRYGDEIAKEMAIATRLEWERQAARAIGVDQ